MATAHEVMEHAAVVIPAYNAGRHLASVIPNVAQQVPGERIIVVDDGSTDETARLARDSGVILVSHAVNRGKGGAIGTGAKKALDMGMEYFFTLDADGQHDPAEMPRFARCAADTGAVIVIGNRMEDRRDMPFLRVFANTATSAFVSLRSGQKIPDSQNGYRLHRAEIFQKFTLETTRYDAESEILIKAARFGRIMSVPVKTIYGDEVSSVNPFIDTARFFRMVFRSLFW
jgi:glycosyltransferase involved in cell wall biosynthesis